MSFGKVSQDFLFNMKFLNLAHVYSNRTTCFLFPYIQQQGKALCKVEMQWRDHMSIGDDLSLS